MAAKGYYRTDISNISPFARDMVQILLDDSSAFYEIWHAILDEMIWMPTVSLASSHKHEITQGLGHPCTTTGDSPNNPRLFPCQASVSLLRPRTPPTLRVRATDIILTKPGDIIILDYPHLIFYLMYSYFTTLSTNNDSDSCQKIIHCKGQ